MDGRVERMRDKVKGGGGMGRERGKEKGGERGERGGEEERGEGEREEKEGGGGGSGGKRQPFPGLRRDDNGGQKMPWGIEEGDEQRVQIHRCVSSEFAYRVGPGGLV